MAIAKMIKQVMAQRQAAESRASAEQADTRATERVDRSGPDPMMSTSRLPEPRRRKRRLYDR
jgi:hypothetical protein